MPEKRTGGTNCHLLTSESGREGRWVTRTENTPSWYLSLLCVSGDSRFLQVRRLEMYCFQGTKITLPELERSEDE